MTPTFTTLIIFGFAVDVDDVRVVIRKEMYAYSRLSKFRKSRNKEI